ncbi:MAG: cation diffusion facilitator family transporter [Mycobacteriales bacterium]
MPGVSMGRAAVSGGHGHGHAHGRSTATADQRSRLTAVLAITITIVVTEVVGGLAAHSLVLLADAAHMTADAGGLGLSLLAVYWARRPATARRTFGYERAEILAAVFNAVLLLVLGAFLVVEATRRIVHPERSSPTTMIVFGVVAILGNGISLLLLARGRAGSLNVRGAYLEVLSDLLGAAAVIVAAAIIAGTGWQRADPVGSLFIAILILPRTLRLLKQAVDVLLEATPDGVDLDDVRRHICETPGVLSCHDLHAWTITSGSAVLSAHVVVADHVWADGTAPEVLDRLGACLSGHFDLEHSTFQLERQSHAEHEPVLHR